MTQKKIGILILIFFCLINMAWASRSYKKYNRSEKITVYPVIGLSANKNFRGALVWDAPILIAAAGLNFYNRVQMGKGGISFMHNINRHQLSLGFSGFNDDRPKYVAFSLQDVVEDKKNSRADTFEVYLKYRYSLGFLVFSTSYYQDVHAHHGHYIASELIVRLIPYTGVNIKVGFADAKHNKYLYGPEAVGGIANWDISLNWRFMILPANGALMLSVGKDTIAQEQNRNAYYVKGVPNPLKATILCMWIF